MTEETNNQIIKQKHEVISSVIETANTNFDVIEAIKKLDIITPEEISQFKNAQAFALSNFRDVPTYRPMIVKLTSVLSDAAFQTNDRKYWQCKKEAEVHFNELTRDYYKYQRAIVDIEEMSYKIEEMEKLLNKEIESNQKLDPRLVAFDKKRLEIQKSQHEYELKLLEKDIKYRIQEVVDWNIISKDLMDKCEYSTTDYQEHTIKAHILFLKYKIKTDPTTTDIEKRNFQSQLDTFTRLNKRT